MRMAGPDTIKSPKTPFTGTIREWVEKRFSDDIPKVFIELGAHLGEDTKWMAALPGVHMIALEPDPRNCFVVRPYDVTIYPWAISDRLGQAPLLLSDQGYGRDWTFSSSLKKPKTHLSRHPVTFGKTVMVKTVTLDWLTAGLDVIDLIWADVQGAEREMIAGGTVTLKRTRFLYTEYSNCEMYEGQPTLSTILEMLGPDWEAIGIWSEDVLLANTRFPC